MPRVASDASRLKPLTSTEPRTAKGKRTKAALVRAARDVFEQRGFLDARITDISNAAGLAHGSFYGYFDSKEAIFREVLRAVVGDIFDTARRQGERLPDPVQAIEAANRRFLEGWAKNARILAILHQVATFNDEFRSLWRDIRRLFVDRAERGLRSLQEQNLIDPTLDPHVAAAALGGMVENFAVVWLVEGEPFDADLVVTTLTTFWARAIGLEVAAEQA